MNSAFSMALKLRSARTFAVWEGCPTTSDTDFAFQRVPGATTFWTILPDGGAGEEFTFFASGFFCSEAALASRFAVSVPLRRVLATGVQGRPSGVVHRSISTT